MAQVLRAPVALATGLASFSSRQASLTIRRTPCLWLMAATGLSKYCPCNCPDGKGLWLCVVLCLLALTTPLVDAQDKTSDGVTIVQRIDQMEIQDTGSGPVKDIPVKIAGSTGLKLAFLARATGGIATVPLNMFDSQAKDNTTPKVYAQVDESWRPILYRCERFRYNAGDVFSTVRAETTYENVRLHGPPTPAHRGVLYIRTFVIYRGEDLDPPMAPTGVVGVLEKTGVRLSWKEPDDNVAVARYVISRAARDGKFFKVAESPSPAYLDTPPTTGDYRYRILAVDFQDNLSLWSEPVAVRSEKTFPAPKLTNYEADRLGYAEHIRKIHLAGKGKVVKGRVFQFGDSLTGALNYQLLTEAALGRYTVEARGRAGWTSSQGRTVITSDMKEMNPEFCLILYGTNNVKDQQAIGAAMLDMLAMAKGCEDNGTVPIVATIPPSGFTDPYSKPEADYNAALVKTCRDHKIPAAYLFEELQAEPDRKKFLANDGVHWENEGFAIAGRVWKKAMDQVTFVLLDRPD